MWSSSNLGHLDDAGIVCYLDGELSSEETRAVREHLSSCWSCRTREADIARATAGFVHQYHRRYGEAVPPLDSSRQVLAARLASLDTGGRPAFGGRRILSLSVVVTAAIVCFVLAPRFFSPAEAIRPNARVSPGIAAAVNREYVCRMAAVDANGISPATAEQVFRRYGIRKPQSGSYEIDYVVPPALGGSQTVDNLWPQRYNAGQWNSRIKDALEDHLETLVCTGSLDVRQAQLDLKHDWITAYKRYFHADRPLPSHINFSKDRPWQFALNEVDSGARP